MINAASRHKAGPGRATLAEKHPERTHRSGRAAVLVLDERLELRSRLSWVLDTMEVDPRCAIGNLAELLDDLDLTVRGGVAEQPRRPT